MMVRTQESEVVLCQMLKKGVRQIEGLAAAGGWGTSKVLSGLAVQVMYLLMRVLPACLLVKSAGGGDPEASVGPEKVYKDRYGTRHSKDSTAVRSMT